MNTAVNASGDNNRQLKSAQKVSRSPKKPEHFSNIDPCIGVRLCLFAEFFSLPRFPSKSAHNPDPSIIFLRGSLHDPFGNIGARKVSANAAEVEHRENQYHRNQRQGDQSHKNIHGEHHRHGDHKNTDRSHKFA